MDKLRFRMCIWLEELWKASEPSRGQEIEASNESGGFKLFQEDAVSEILKTQSNFCQSEYFKAFIYMNWFFHEIFTNVSFEFEGACA